ncbi:MAG: hypothetical protein NVS3B7_03120 [Candidatus Elarobacter sp.]
MDVVIFALVVTLLVVGVSVWYVRGYYGRRQRAFERCATPLLPVIGGSVDKQTIRGTYAGAPVTAKIVGLSMSQADETGYQYDFRVALADVGGASEWSLRGTDARQIQSKDAAVIAGLTSSGAIEAMERWPSGYGTPVVHFQPKVRTLEASTRVADYDRWPDPATFAAQLDALAALAQSNRGANAGVAAG